MIRTCLLATGAILFAAPTLAQDTVSTGTMPEKKICKTIVPTGSIMGKRFCLTKTEWRQLDQINERAVDVATGQMNKISAPKAQ